MADVFDLKGKVAVVTGGMGGLGTAISLALAERGADIVTADLKFDAYKDQERKIKALGRKSLAVSVDVTSEKSVADMVASILKVFPTIDILVNAHGTVNRKSADTIPVEEWQKVIDVNTRGTFIICQAVGRVMIKQKSGKIVNLSSVRGRYGAPSGAVAYSPSKGAVDALTRTLACEWAKYNVLVNAVAPTLVETDLTREALANPEFAKTMIARIPLGRWAMPDDIAWPIVFLASKASDFITGQILYIDGGTTTW
jgi:NAD(P)-dependent dehydrogenase (short-subunit alcohol dehydrogenase family)